MALIIDPEMRQWRTGNGSDNGHEIYALIWNDVTKPSRDDLMIGTMDTSALAEEVVDMHNRVLRKFGRHYKRMLAAEDE